MTDVPVPLTLPAHAEYIPAYGHELKAVYARHHIQRASQAIADQFDEEGAIKLSVMARLFPFTRPGILRSFAQAGISPDDPLVSYAADSSLVMETPRGPIHQAYGDKVPAGSLAPGLRRLLLEDNFIPSAEVELRRLGVIRDGHLAAPVNMATLTTDGRLDLDRIQRLEPDRVPAIWRLWDILKTAPTNDNGYVEFVTADNQVMLYNPINGTIHGDPSRNVKSTDPFTVAREQLSSLTQRPILPFGYEEPNTDSSVDVTIRDPESPIETQGIPSLSTLTQVATSAMNAPLQELTGQVRNIYGALHGNEYNPLESQSDLGVLLGNPNLSMGSGYFVDPHSAVAVERREREATRGQVGGHNISIGRLVANTVTEPDTAPFNLISGLTDAAAAIKADPFSWGAKGSAAAATARRTFISQAEREAIENAGGIAGAVRRTINRPTAQSFLNSDDGVALKNALANEGDPFAIASSLNFKVNPGIASRLASARTPERVHEVLAEVIGPQIRTTTELTQALNPSLARPFESAMSVTRETVTDIARSLNIRYGQSRLARRLPGRRIDTYDVNQAARDIVSLGYNNGLPEDQIRTAYNIIAEGYNPVHWGWKASGATREIMTEQPIERGAILAAANKIMEDTRGLLEGQGISPRIREQVTRLHQDNLRADQAGLLGDIASDVPTFAYLGVDGVLSPIDELNPHLATEYLARYIDLPDPMQVKRLTSRFRFLTAKHALPEAVHRATGRRLPIPRDYRTPTGELNLPLSTLEWMQDYLWKPSVLLRLAWPVRVIGEEQLRMAAQGLDSMFRHPISYVAWAVGRKGNALGDAASESWQYRNAMSQGRAWLRRPGALRTNNLAVHTKAQDAQYYRSWAQNLAQLRTDPVSRKALESANYDEWDAWFTTGEGRIFRSELFDNGELVIGQERAYFDQIMERVQLLTSGNSDLLDSLKTGRLGKVPMYKDEPVRMNSRFISGLEDYYDAAPETVVGYDVVATKDHLDGWRRGVEAAFGWLMSKPTNSLSRSVTFRQSYWKHVEQLLPYASKSQQEKILAQVREGGREFGGSLPSGLVKRLKRVASYGSDMNLTAHDIDELAKGYALDDTRKLLYDLNERGRIADAMSLVFPFGEAWKEFLTRWFSPTEGLVRQTHGLPVRRLQQSVTALRGEELQDFMVDIGATPEFLEGQGFFHKNQYGQEVFVYPFSHHITGTIPNLIPGMQGAPFPLTGSVQGLSMMTDVMPGIGPVAQIPVAHILDVAAERSPEVAMQLEELLLPFGSPDDPNALLPAWGRALVQATGGDPVGFFERDARGWGNAIKDAMSYLSSTGGYGTSRAEINRLEEDAQRVARSLYLIETIGKFSAPTSPNRLAVIEDKSGNTLALHTFLDEYYDLLDSPQSDQAMQIMLDKYGLDTFRALTPKSSSDIYGVPSTVPASIFMQRHPELKENYPNTYGFFLPQSDDPSDFDLDTMLATFRSGEKESLNPEDWAHLANHNRATNMYLQEKNSIAGEDGEVTRGQQLYLNDYREWLEYEYPGFNNPRYESRKPDPETMIRELRQVVEENAGRSVARTDAYRGLKLYLTEWDATMAQLEAEGISLTNSRAEGRRSYLLDYGEWVVSQHPDFRLMWNVVFSRELEG